MPVSSLSPLHAAELYKHLQGGRLWRRGMTFQLSDDVSYTLPHDVVRRVRKDGRSGYRFEFIGNRAIGRGNFGAVFNSEGTLTESQLKIKKRVIKVQQHDSDSAKQSVYDEYRRARMAGELSVKRPTRYGKRSYTVMKKITWPSLENTDVNSLTVAERMDLSLALLEAVKTQLTDKGLIHRDLKPEHFFVKMGSPIRVKIIDFGLATDADKPDGRYCGSLFYVAPELWTRQANCQSVKLDVFSLGRVLAPIWNVHPYSYEHERNRRPGTNYLFDLFFGLSMTASGKRAIHDALSGMLQDDPNQRTSIADALSAFRRIQADVPLIASELDSTELLSGQYTGDYESSVSETQFPKKSDQSMEDVFAAIEEVQRMAELMKTWDKKGARELQDVCQTLETNLQTLPDDPEKARATISACQKLVTSKTKSFKSNVDLTCVLRNVGLFLAGFGMVYVAASCVHKHNTGRYLFFSSPKRLDLLQGIANKLQALAEQETSESPLISQAMR